MQAILNDRYGPVDALRLRDIEPPTIGAAEVLVRVHASALHIGDVFAIRGRPLPMRLMTGLTRPTYGVPGFDLAGTVEAVGANVTRFKPGDDVFGTGHGTTAELARADETTLAPKPPSLTFEEAAAIPTSALAALHGLRAAGGTGPGKRVLINGAAGGVGTFAVQLAKAQGAHVTAVTSSGNAALVRSLGADDVIDYARDDFTATSVPFDLIFDNVENLPIATVRRALAPDGTLLLNSGRATSGLHGYVRLMAPFLLSRGNGQRIRRFLSKPNAEDLAELARLIEDGKLRPAIERSYRITETAEALRRIEAGHAAGKLVIAIA
jgi:NADPH:quinone reductase-like Zn-dependent oxidoreductase